MLEQAGASGTAVCDVQQPYLVLGRQFGTSE